MKSIFNALVGTVAAAAMLTGCIEETFPTSGPTAGQVAQSESALAAMVRAIPSEMTDYGAVYSDDDEFGYAGLMTSFTHAVGDIVFTDGSVYNWFYEWGQGLYLSEMYNASAKIWYQYYPWIKLCNDVISSLATVAEEDLNPEQKAYLGIALTYRAQLYLDLARLFEPKECTDPKITGYEIPDKIKGLTTVIVTEETTEDQLSNNPRATVDEIYTLIFSDLTRAERLLDGYTRESMTMPDLSVVYGVLARAWIERGYDGVEDAFANAAKYARLAINTGSYSPLTQEQWEDPINGFNNASSNSSWMWALSFSPTNMTNLLAFVSHMSNDQSWSIYRCGRGINSNLYNSIADDDFRKHSWLDPDKFNYYNYKSPRSDYRTYYANTLKPYAAIKFRPAEGNCDIWSTGNVIDYPLMRIEEMYLIEAEATAATSYASGISLLESFMRTYRQPSYTCTSGSLKSFRTEIGRQARIEFWGEGIPFWYAKRLELGIHMKGAEYSEDDYRYELDGVAPWWNACINIYEVQGNLALVDYNNPDPSGRIEPELD